MAYIECVHCGETVKSSSADSHVEVCKEHPVNKKLNEYDVETYRGPIQDYQNCQVCGESGVPDDMVAERMPNVGVVFTCKSCVASAIRRNELRKQGRFEARLK